MFMFIFRGEEIMRKKRKGVLLNDSLSYHLIIISDASASGGVVAAVDGVAVWRWLLLLRQRRRVA